MTQERPLEILKILSKAPAVAFHETLVSDLIKEILNDSRILFDEDDFGNIIAKINGSDPSSSPIAFVAHMDHPGFEVNFVSEEKITATPLGGVPYSTFVKGADCFILNEKFEKVSCVLKPNDDIAIREVQVLGIDNLKVNTPIFFNIEDFSMDEEFIHMRALDDLAGCAAIIAALENVIKDSSINTVYGIFTRAEEVGLIGARLLAKAKVLPLNSFIVSVETSSVIPGVIQNEGPVIRTGDASYTFDSEAEQVLLSTRDILKKEDPDFKCQRNLMSAGSCEASAFMANGYRATGVAFPLGNWHNATTEIKDPDSRIGSENIGIFDFLNGVKLIERAMKYAHFWNPKLISERYKHIDEGFMNRLSGKTN